MLQTIDTTMNKRSPGFVERPNIPIIGGIPGFYIYNVEGVQVVICPFNKSHMLKASRIQYHIVKCAKSQPKGMMVPCPFNASEYLAAEDLIGHMAVCERRKQEVQRNFRSAKASTDPTRKVPIQQECPYVNDEEW